MKVIYFLFGGWGSANAGQPINATVKTGTTQLINSINVACKAAQIDLKMHACEGSQSVQMHQCLRFLSTHFDPNAVLMLHGYSMGGFNALQVSWKFSWLAYDPAHKAIVRSPGGGKLVPLRFKLATTIDIARGPTSSGASRRIWPSVDSNLNIYQTHQSSVYSCGGPTTAVDPKKTTVKNEDWSAKYKGNPGGAHGKIDNDAVAPCMTAIKKALGI